MSAERGTARVGLVATLGLMYASACGGPYGTEDYIPKIGPGLFLLLLFATPWLWGVPTALSTAELSARNPIAGGYYKWGQIYLGDAWGYLDGMWNVLSSLLDNALYPVLFAKALGHVIPGMTAFERWMAAVGFILFLTWLNYRGIKIAGATAVAFNIFLLAPLVWLIVAAVFHQPHHTPFSPFVRPGIDAREGLGTCLALSIWLYSGYTEVSVAAAEIENPRRNIPLALIILTPLVVLSYALPYVACLWAAGGWEAWESGQFATLGEGLGGTSLGNWLFLGSVASQAVIFLSYLLFWSRLVWAMAKDHHFPRFLSALHPRYGTPHRILIVYAVLYSVMAAMPFDDLLVADAWLAGASALLLQASLVMARRKEGVLKEGFQVPGGMTGVWLAALVPGATWILLLVLTARGHFLVGAIALLLAPTLYLLERLLGTRGGQEGETGPLP
jgi:amino acid transporter